MAYLDTTGAGTLRVLRTEPAHALTAVYDAIPIDPADGSTVPATNIPFRVAVSSVGATLTDVEVQVDDDPAFGSPLYSNVHTDLGDGELTPTIAGFTDGVDYYWRVRASEAGMAAWTAWKTAAFSVDLLVGRSSFYTFQNVTPEPMVALPDSTYVYINNGIADIDEFDGVAYVETNIAYLIVTDPLNAYHYADEGDVSTNTPEPHIWFLRPTSGRSGDGIQIVGFGFGDLQTTYSGIVEYRPDLVWQALAVTSWQTFPPTANAYTDDRVLDAVLGIIDMQHTVIEFTVPATAESPGFPVRVITDGA
ncbi:hypothetical protein [Agromyces sp. SYSU T00194]|uniref:hypothetical protein n=1 Tax=Agromyces chitinivorans TaxID=3158560 RepID=UPI003397626D